MCKVYVTRHSCGHYRPGYRLCGLITREEIEWIEENNDFMTIINNCRDYIGQKTIRVVDEPCGRQCLAAFSKAQSFGWRCCDCSIRCGAAETICGCGHSFCGIGCYALGPDESAKMSGPFERGITLPMDIRPVKRWGSFTGSTTGFRWVINSDSDRSDRSS
ncbi:hypothetical protein BDZ91DRAFT_272700 [Kalaharituber pfeilii]|nr:hypothetical protein BDZ91DRAFT_272700 [Kalaharituber pfeilii]